MFELLKFDQVCLSASISLLFLLLIFVKTHLFQVVKSESDIDTKCRFLSFNITSIGRKSDIDTKYLQSFCINFTPPPPSPCPLHPPCSPVQESVWCQEFYSLSPSAPSPCCLHPPCSTRSLSRLSLLMPSLLPLA